MFVTTEEALFLKRALTLFEELNEVPSHEHLEKFCRYMLSDAFEGNRLLKELKIYNDEINSNTCSVVDILSARMDEDS